MKKITRKSIIISCVIAICVAVVSLCCIFFGNRELLPASGESVLIDSTSENAREIPSVEISDTTFSGGTFVVQSKSNVTITNCTFTNSSTGAIDVKENATLNLIGCSFTSNILRDKDGAALSASGSTVNISDCTFEENGDDNYEYWCSGGSISSVSSHITIENTTFVDCVSSGDGGAMHVSGNSNVLVIGGVIFENCECPNGGEGGAIFIGGTSKVEIKGSNNVISECMTSSLHGGAIALRDDSCLIIEDCVIEDCYSDGVGGIYNNGGTVTIKGGTIENCGTSAKGGFLYNEGILNIEGGIISGRSSTDDGVEYAGIYNGGTINIRGGTIENCGTSAKGGFLYNEGILNIEDGTISGDGTSTASRGGAIYNAGTLNIRGGTIENFVATEKGGAIFNESSKTFNMSGGTIRNSKVLNSDGTGGSVYNAGTFNFSGGTIIGDGTTVQAYQGAGVYNTGTLNIIGGTIQNVVSEHSGAGVYNISTTNFSSGLISGNTSKTKHGGGIFSGKDLVIGNGAVVQDNKASDKGGGVYSTNGTFTLDGKIIGNDANQGDGVSVNTGTFTMNSNAQITGNKGHGIYAYTGTYNLNGGKISANTTNGITAYSGTTIYLGSVEISSHNTSVKGAGIYCNGGKIVPNGNALIQNNTTTSSGGGIYIENGASLDDEANVYQPSLTIKNNTASGSGGGLYANGATVEYGVHLYIDGNRSGMSGGGMYVVNSSVDCGSGSKIINNVSNGDGAGAYLENNSYFYFDGVEISGNKIETTGIARGAGVCYINSPQSNIQFPIDASIISNNGKSEKSQYSSGVVYGGGIYASGCGGSSTFCNVDIENNTADYGGGVYVVDSVLALDGTTCIQENTSFVSGGGVYVSNTTLGFYWIDQAISISSNTAGANGGGIFAESNSELNLFYENRYEYNRDMVCCVIDNNTAQNAGGGIYCDASSSFSLDLVNITQNTANGSGGGIYVLGDFSADDTTISSNIAGNNGGGIYVESTTIVCGENITVNGNKASESGGGIYACDAEINLVTTIGVNDNESARHGGGIYSSNSLFYQNSDLRNSIISTCNNVAGGNGGGIYFINGSRMDSYESLGLSVKENNSLGNGGGIFIDDSSIFATYMMDVSNNTAVNGGGIFATSSDIESSAFSLCVCDNAVTGNGGGIYASGLSFAFYNANDFVISSNSAGNNGGGIWCENKSTFDSNGHTLFICENSASQGGGIYLSNTSLTLNEKEEISNNSATRHGGGIALSGSTLTIDGETIIEENFAGNNGGGIYADKDSMLNITKAEIRLNTIGSATSSAPYPNGGGIYVRSSALNISSDNAGDVKIHGNGKATGTQYQNSRIYGGGMYLSNPTLCKISGEGVEVYGNDAYFGAGIFLSGVTTGENDLLSGFKVHGNNSVNRGGGFYVAGGDLTIGDVEIYENSSDDGGGGIHIDPATVILDGTQILSNSALSHGAGINTSHVNSLIMRGNTIVDDNHIAPENVANGKYPGRGAGVLIYGGTFVMEGGTISNNVVGGASNRCLGAGLYVSDGGHVTMNDGATILNNGFDVPPGVPTYGANVYLKSEVDQENVDGSFTVLDPTFVMNGGVINGGGVQSATLGGGIFNLGILDINGGTIQNCYAENGGGAIAHFGSSFNIANVTIDGCGEYSDNGYFEENAIISNDEIVVDGSFENVHGTIALGTSELYGEESEDISLADGDYIQTMRTASINVTAESDDGSYEIIFFALVQSYVETIHNCEYRIDYDDYSHMNAFYFDGFEEDEYVSHSDKYIYKTPKSSNNESLVFYFIGYYGEAQYRYEISDGQEFAGSSTYGYRLGKIHHVLIEYYKEIDSQFVFVGETYKMVNNTFVSVSNNTISFTDYYGDYYELETFNGSLVNDLGGEQYEICFDGCWNFFSDNAFEQLSSGEINLSEIEVTNISASYTDVEGDPTYIITVEYWTDEFTEEPYTTTWEVQEGTYIQSCLPADENQVGYYLYDEDGNMTDTIFVDTAWYHPVISDLFSHWEYYDDDTNSYVQLGGVEVDRDITIYPVYYPEEPCVVILKIVTNNGYVDVEEHQETFYLFEGEEFTFDITNNVFSCNINVDGWEKYVYVGGSAGIQYVEAFKSDGDYETYIEYDYNIGNYHVTINEDSIITIEIHYA